MLYLCFRRLSLLAIMRRLRLRISFRRQPVPPKRPRRRANNMGTENNRWWAYWTTGRPIPLKPFPCC